MKKLRKIALLTSFLVALGTTSFSAQLEETPRPKSLVRSNLPTNDPFSSDEEGQTAPAPIPQPRAPSVRPRPAVAIPAAPAPRTQGTVRRIAANLEGELGLTFGPSVPTENSQNPLAREASAKHSAAAPTSLPPAELNKGPSVKSLKSEATPAVSLTDAESLRSNSPVPTHKFCLSSLFSCGRSKSAHLGSLSLEAPVNPAEAAAQPTISEAIKEGAASDSLTEENVQSPAPAEEGGYATVAPGDDENSSPAAGDTNETESSEIAPPAASVNNQEIPETVVVSDDSKNDPQPEVSDEAILPAADAPFVSPQEIPVVAETEKKTKSSWWRSFWPKAKRNLAVVEEDLERAFVDVAPYLEDGLKLVAASAPNPAIQAVINFLAILIKDASSAVTQDGATFDLITKDGQKVTVASPPLLHAHNFSNNGNLSEESKMVISIILDRTALTHNYGDLIGFINMVVAQDNTSPETIRFDGTSGSISLYPNDIEIRPVLLSVPILDSLRNPSDKETTRNILLEYVAATESRNSVEKILGTQGSNFLPTPASWVRSAFQDLVEQNSPFVLDSALDIEKGIEESVRQEAAEKEAQLSSAGPKDKVRAPLPTKK